MERGTGERQGDNEKEGTEVEREKSDEREAEQDQDLVAGLCGENRNFIAVQLGGQMYRALFDPGAMLSLVRPQVAERFEDRLKDSVTAVRTVTGGITRVMGVLNVMLEIDHQAKPLPMKALHNLDQEIILKILRLLQIVRRRCAVWERSVENKRRAVEIVRETGRGGKLSDPCRVCRNF